VIPIPGVPASVRVPVVVIPETLILVAVAAPNTGVTRVGEVANTATPEPVSSVRAVAKSEELNEPNDVVVLTDVIAPVKLGILVVDDAVPVTLPTKPLVAVIIPDALILVATNEVTVETPAKSLYYLLHYQ
jgi:hypothetical protein